MLFGFSIQTGEEIQIIQAAVPFLDIFRKAYPAEIDAPGFSSDELEEFPQAESPNVKTKNTR